MKDFRDLVKLKQVSRDHLKKIIDLEIAYVEEPISLQDLTKCLDFKDGTLLPDKGGIVLEKNGSMIAYSYFQLFRTKIQIRRLFVHPDHRRCGVGEMIINYYLKKLIGTKKKELFIDVPLRKLDVLNFLKKFRFLSVQISEDAFIMPDGSKDDGIRMTISREHLKDDRDN